MVSIRKIQVSFLALLFAVLGLAPTGAVATEDVVYNLSNGMKVILRENHSSPMIASVVFVKSGSKYESRYENGITHFLEHLLFDGTVNLSREQLDGSIRDLGGMINAFTRKELTAYLVLMPRQYFDYGLTVQADMLFNSVFPEDELVKERKVVLEEIKRDTDSPGAPAEAFYVEKAYAGTDYKRPVLGYQAFIENIPRQAIIDYWKRYYTPGNMTALIIGDFETDSMKATVEATFGSIVDTSVAARDRTGLQASATATVVGRAISGQSVFDTVASVTSTYVNFSFEAPHHSDPDYLAVDLVSQYLNMEDISPLMSALKGGPEALATEVSVSLVPYEEFSRLEISIITENPDNADAIVVTTAAQLKAIAEHMADNESLEGIKTSVRTSDIYNSEKLYFLAFMISPMMMSTGWDFIQTYPDQLSKVTWADCQRVAGKWFETPDYAATIVRPVGETGMIPYAPQQMSADEVLAFFDTSVFKAYDLEQGYSLTYPRTDSVSLMYEDPSEYHREVLSNGLTVIIKSNPDTRVFAMNIIGKGRSANESDTKAGITDFVNRCLEKGTLTRNASELSRDLAKIGANVTLYDNPWIPYDDRYTTRRFSFMKFETIDEFAEKGFHLFTEMILYPSFDSVEVENVRRSMMGTLGRDSGSPSKVARDSFYAALFEGKPYAKPIMGTPRTLAMITAADLKAHHATYYSPSNMILSIVTSRPVSQVKEWVDLAFGRLTYPEFVSTECGRPEPLPEKKLTHTDLEKEQVSIYLGCLLPDANHVEATSINVATTILSNRLYLTLREKQGLAYSVGAGSTLDRHFGWFHSSIGTASNNYQAALDGMLLQIDKLSLDGPSPEEVSNARNQVLGSQMRAELSSINQAYYLGVNEYLGRGLDYNAKYLESLADVNVGSVIRAASTYFRTDVYVVASAGKRP